MTNRKVISKNAYFQTINYKPHPRQQEYHDSQARFKGAVAGRRFGKSLMAGRDLEPELLVPGGRYWIVGPTYDLGEKEFRVVWDDMIIAKGLGDAKGVRKAYNKQQGNMYIEFPWQTRLEVRTADRPENLVGESLDGVIMSEAAKHKQETWAKYIRPALADRRGWASFPTTPEGMNWIYDLWQLGQDPNRPEYASWRFPSWENSAIYPGGFEDPEIQLLLATLARDEFDQEIAALFTSFVGKIFPDFSEETHVKDFGYNPMWPNYMCYDFGFVNPFVCAEVQIDPMDNIWIWREYSGRGMSVDQHAQKINSREQPDGYKIDLATGDAADPASSNDVSRFITPCLSLPEAKADWREGIDMVNRFVRLRSSTEVTDRHDTPADDVPKLFVSRDCPKIIREFSNYKSQKGTPARSPKEVARNVDDHFMDALRYLLVTIYKLGATHSLSDTMPELGAGVDYHRVADLHLPDGIPVSGIGDPELDLRFSDIMGKEF